LTYPLKGELLSNVGSPVTAAFSEAMKRRIPRLMNRYDVPGLIIGVVQDGKLVWKDAFGYADVPSETPMTTETLCRMESLSKTVTAVGVINLAKQGLIDLDRPVINYLHSWEFPETSFPVEEITWRMLLSHTSGLPLGTIGVKYLPAQERPSLRESLTEEAIPVCMPGSTFCYSNTGYNLLELLIEEVTARDFSMYMHDEILKPLGMMSSGYRCKPRYAKQVPTGYDVGGNPVALYVYPEKGSGGLFSTLEDYSRFLIGGVKSGCMSNDHHSGEDMRDLMYQPQVKISGLYGFAFPFYGLGHFIEPLADGNTAVSHGGQGSGWMTHFHYLPEQGDGIIIFCNSQRSWPLFAHILRDWSEWGGGGKIGMGRIVSAAIGLWAINISIGLVSISIIGRMLYGLICRNRLIKGIANQRNFTRFATFILGLILIVCFVITALQDYLFITAVFPIAAPWFGYVMLLLAVALILRSMVPAFYSRDKNKKQ